MNRDHEYTRELAATCARLIGDGKTDPSAEEIVKAHFEKSFFPDDMIEGGRRRLIRIKKILKEEFGLDVCLVSRIYYKRYRRHRPENADEARECLPITGGRDSF